MSSPSTSFTTLNPPAWLQEDMARAARSLPGVKTLVMFRDEVDAKAPVDFLQDKLRHAFDISSDAARLMVQQPDNAPLSEAFLTHDARQRHHVGTCPVSGLTEGRLSIYEAPKHALIMLPSRNISPAAWLRQRTGFTHIEPDGGNLQRGALRHELGHLRMALRAGTTIRARVDEQTADLSVRHGWGNGQDTETADSFVRCRVLSNLASGISAPASIYWNDLSLLGVTQASEADNMASLLELKLRSLGQAPHTSNPQAFVRDVMVADSYSNARSAFNQLRTPERAIQHLQEQHYRAYTFQHTRRLAEAVFEAAEKLSPIACSPT